MKIVNRICGGFFLVMLLWAIAPSTQPLLAAPLHDETIGVPTTLTLTANGSGSIDAQPIGPTYGYGDVVMLTALPDPGYEFVAWSGDLTSVDNWWSPLWSYRLAINVGANGYERTDRPVEAALDFAALLTGAGVGTAFDPASVRVVEIGSDGQVTDDGVLFQFDDVDGDGAGTLVLMMGGTTNANQGRTFHVYFDVAGKGFTAKSFTDRVVLTDNVTDQGQASFQVQIDNATYYYHKKGGGFSSLVDVNNKDWISYRKSSAGATGTYRGMPNMIYPEGEFHPGETGSTSTVVSSGPLKETIRTVTNDGKWEATWEFYPTYARMALLKKDHDYWFLYEGTPGGSFDGTDLLTRSDGTQNLLSDDWQGDISGEEWVYISDAGLQRSIFLVHNNDDTMVDSYKPLSNAMTVFGFGRQNGASFINQVPAYFTVGLIDEVSYAPAAKTIRGAYKDLVVNALPLESYGQHQQTIQATEVAVDVPMFSNRSLTATFRPLVHTLTLQSTGQGTVTAAPEKANYEHGETVTLTANPNLGWMLDSWSGDLSGATTPDQITMDGDKSVTATFVRIPYQITTDVVGSGTVTKDPDQSTYFYDDAVALTAVADAGWTFDSWSGDLSGTTAAQSITVSANHVVTATFLQDDYTVVTTTIGSGTVSYSPAQASYHYGDNVTFQATAAAGWAFAGWEGDLTGTTSPTDLTIAGDSAVTARFTPINYTLTLSQTGEGTVLADPAQTSYRHGDQVTLTATPAAGWRFTGWSGDRAGTSNLLILSITQSLNIHATFEQIPYTLTVEQTTGGTVTWAPLQTTYFYGDLIEFNATTDADYHFLGWEGALSGNTNPAQLTITGDATVSAKFTKTPYQITTNVVGSGTVTRSPEQEYYGQGDEVTLTAVPADGWVFAGWGGELSGASSPLMVSISDNLSVTAQFVKDAYTIFLSEESTLGTVTISPQKQTYDFGEQITLTAIPKPGYRFVRWVIAPDSSRASTDNPLMLTVEDDMIIKPEYAESNAPLNAIYLPFIAK